MMKSESLWAELESEARTISGIGVLKRMLSPDAACTMFLGVQRPSLNRLFLLQAPRNMMPTREQMPESQGFMLDVQITGEEASTHATFVLAATDPKYNEIFSAMVENLYRSLKVCEQELQIVREFLARLAQWQQFFESNTLNGLSDESQRGLYGELYFLKNYVLSTPGAFVAEVAAWTGPKNRQHDFQFGDVVVEVKTSSAKQHQKLMITSEQQLDETLVGTLFLFHLSVSKVENHADTLPALVQNIRKMLHPDYAATVIFEDALLARGYLDPQSWRYEKTGYTIRDSNFYRVAGKFPRLTERNLPTGVGDLKYSISVSECKHFAVSPEEVMTHIGRGKS